MAFPEFQLAPIASCPFSGYHSEVCLCLYILSSDIYTHGYNPLSLIFSGMASSQYLKKAFFLIWHLMANIHHSITCIGLLSEHDPAAPSWLIISPKAKLHEFPVHFHVKCKTCCGSLLPSPVIPMMFLPHLVRQILSLCSHL